MKFVELDEARGARGLRLVVAGRFPSPWSQAAMGLFDMKAIDYLAVRFRAVADSVREWTGSPNAPVVVYDDEPPRTGWAEILALAERLGGRLSLVPSDADRRVRLHGLAHEILGEGGLCWSARLLMIHASFESAGREGWPSAVADSLAGKYGYAPERAAPARQRAVDVLECLGRTLESSQARGFDYYLGEAPSALDVYSAAGVGPIVPLPHEVCPMLAPVRHAFGAVAGMLRAAVPASIIRHRDLMYERHLPLPVRF
jgi:hypothetical protein